MPYIFKIELNSEIDKYDRELKFNDEDIARSEMNNIINQICFSNNCEFDIKLKNTDTNEVLISYTKKKR